MHDMSSDKYVISCAKVNRKSFPRCLTPFSKSNILLSVSQEKVDILKAFFRCHLKTLDIYIHIYVCRIQVQIN